MKKRILSLFTMVCMLAAFMPTLIVKANSTKYKVFEQKMTFEEAEEYCNSIGGHLVSITSEEEQRAVEAVLDEYNRNGGKDADFMIGICKQNSNYSVWTTGEEVTYTNWSELQPDDRGGQYYGVICNGDRSAFKIKKYEWDDNGIEGTKFGFICEWDYINNTTELPTPSVQPADDEYSFYVPSEMNIGDVYSAYVTYGHERLDTASTFRFVDAQMTSSDESVVRLVKLGNSYRVQAAGEGTATVTASFEGKTKTQDVTVTAETAETLDDENVLKAKICTENGEYQYMRDAFENPSTGYASKLNAGAAASLEGLNAMIDSANLNYSPKNYYEIILTEMLANEEFYKTIESKYAVNQITSIVGDSKKIISELLEENNKPVNQILQVPKETLKDQFNINKFKSSLNVKEINAGNVIDALLVVNDTLGAYNEKYNQLRFLALATQEQLNILQGLAESNSGNEEFEEACKNVASVIVEATNMTLADMQMNGIYSGAWEFAKRSASAIVNSLRDLIPGMAIADTIVTGGQFLSNVLFNADALAEDEILLKAYRYIDNIVRQNMKDSEHKFLKEKTSESAVEFMAYADFYKSLNSYGCNLAIRYLDDISKAGVSFFEKDDIAEDKAKVTKIKTIVDSWDIYFTYGVDIAKYLRATVSTEPSAWAKPYIKQAIDLTMLLDYMQNNYQNNITRAEFCTIMTRCLEIHTGKYIDQLIEELGEPGLQVPFDDCMYTYAAYMSRLGIVNGIGNNNFNPLGEITRQEAATMLMRAAEVLGYDVSAPETDISGVADWAAAGVNFVVDRGIMTGTDNGFEPEGTYTKEQAITTMVRFYENLGD